MKRISVAAALASCALAFALALVGCAGGPAKSTDAESLKGFWEIDPSTSMGFNAAVNLDEDDYAEMVVGDAYLEGTWKAGDSQATIVFDNEKEASIYVADGKLIIGQDEGSKLVFVKSDIDEYYSRLDAEAAEEAGAESDEEGDDTEDADDADVTVDAEDGDQEIDMADLEGVDVVDEDIKDITPVSIADDKTCTIQVIGKGTDFTSDPCYKLSIKNNTNKKIIVVADDEFKVDGKSIEAGLGEEIDPGDSIETLMYFAADDLGGGLEKLKNVEGSIFVGEDETNDELATYDFKMD